MRYFAKSDVGRLREGNEDSFLANGKVFAVADGLGGHLAGEVASAAAIEEIGKSFSEVGDDIEAIRNKLAEAFKGANARVFKKASQEPSLKGMGTTLTAVIPVKSKIIIGHVGDSRAYLLRKGKLRRLTEDHSLVFQLVKEGKLKEEDIESHPLKSTLTRAIGTNPSVRIDILSLTLSDNDRFLLCTDGLSSMVSDRDIKEVLLSSNDLDKIIQKLIETANEKGGFDNITCVLLDINQIED